MITEICIANCDVILNKIFCGWCNSFVFQDSHTLLTATSYYLFYFAATPRAIRKSMLTPTKRPEPQTIEEKDENEEDSKADMTEDKGEEPQVTASKSSTITIPTDSDED